MTLTAPNCPVAGTLPGDVERAVRAVPGVTGVKLELVFDPPMDQGPDVGSRQTGARHRRYHSDREAAKTMKLTANEEYGVRCLVRLGYASQGLTIPEISQAEGVSPAYAAKILRTLRKGGFVKAARGKEGGYTLARPAEAIVIGDVIDALGGRLFESDFCDSPLRPGRHLHPFGGLFRALALARRTGARSTRSSAKPPSATCCRTKKR